MKKQNIPLSLFVILVLISCLSCTKVMKTMKGVTRPKLQTPKDIRTYMEKKKPGYLEETYICRDSASCLQILSLMSSLPEVLFFNRNGEAIVYSDSACPYKASEFAGSLDTRKQYRVNPGYTLRDVKERIIPVDPETDTIAKPDFTVVIIWAKYLGKLNNSVFGVPDYPQNNGKTFIRYVFLNVDFQSSWGMKVVPRFK